MIRVAFTLFCLILVSTAAAAKPDLPVNWHGLPEPYASPSAVNPPLVVPRPPGAKLTLPPGFAVSEWMGDLPGARYMTLGPGGEVLVALMHVGKVAVVHDGQVRIILDHLHDPYGLAFDGDWLYVAETTSVKRYHYDAATMRVDGPGKEVIPLEDYAGGHITRSIMFNKSHTKLFLSVGSGSNINTGEPPMRAAISRFNPDGSSGEIYASGLRNAIGLRINPVTGDLWATVQERDTMGDDLVPDYLTRVVEGGFYGWPYAYIGPHEDPHHPGAAPDLVKKTLYPSVILGGHVGAFDLLFYTGKQFPAKYRGGCFVVEHGSWNRSRRAGYKIVFVPFKDGKPTSGPEDFLTGWMLGEDRLQVWGRPISLLQLPDGSLLISDDGGDKIWRVTYAPPS